MNEVTKEKIKPYSIYPTLPELKDVFILGETQLPIQTKNDLSNLLCTYHNTLLSSLDKERK